MVFLCAKNRGVCYMFGYNGLKSVTNDEYYDVGISRGSGRNIFLDEFDYRFFLSILEDLILKNDSVEILAYNLDSDYLKILFSQTRKNSAIKLLDNLLGRYDAFFSEKYRTKDLLTKDNCVVVKVSHDDLLNVSRDIHLSSNAWIDHPYSSIRAYFYDDTPEWLSKTHISDIYGSAVEYLEFLESK